MSSPIESPTMRTRRGCAGVGSLGSGGAVVVVVAAPGCGFVLLLVLVLDAPCLGRGPATMSPIVPPGWSFSRPVADTMRDSWRLRLNVATGPVMSRLIV